MLVCPNCNHNNPDGATQCEACFTALPQLVPCPRCSAPVQTDSTFCGNCGNNIIPVSPSNAIAQAAEVAEVKEQEKTSPPESSPSPISSSPLPSAESSPSLPVSPSPESPPSPVSPPDFSSNPATQLQIQTASLLHLASQSSVEFPQGLAVIHIGKPNEQIPPDIDLSGFPHADIVSRIHADIRLEGDAYYLEDVGSANGTYVNHSPLNKGNRHRLRVGDRLSFGKGDLMTFLFQLS
ncbi:MAG: FHA domain-containing protein [Microcystaceae cyanobacterium]